MGNPERSEYTSQDVEIVRNKMVSVLDGQFGPLLEDGVKRELYRRIKNVVDAFGKPVDIGRDGIEFSPKPEEVDGSYAVFVDKSQSCPTRLDMYWVAAVSPPGGVYQAVLYDVVDRGARGIEFDQKLGVTLNARGEPIWDYVSIVNNPDLFTDTVRNLSLATYIDNATGRFGVLNITGAEYELPTDSPLRAILTQQVERGLRREDEPRVSRMMLLLKAAEEKTAGPMTIKEAIKTFEEVL